MTRLYANFMWADLQILYERVGLFSKIGCPFLNIRVCEPLDHVIIFE
jgi:hypothetical protein